MPGSRPNAWRTWIKEIVEAGPRIPGLPTSEHHPVRQAGGGEADLGPVARESVQHQSITELESKAPGVAFRAVLRDLFLRLQRETGLIRGKDPLLRAFSEPIRGTVEFVRAAGRSRITFGLVTQTTRTDIEEQGRQFQLPLEVFGAMEACGDPFYTDMPKTTDKKAIAYAVACAKLGIRPSQALAIEDSQAGLEAAAAAGITAIGLKEPHNRQDLSAAALEVSDLGQFADPEIIGKLVNADRERALEILRERSTR